MTTVSFEQVTRCCPGADRPAVDALRPDIAEGESLVLVGPSGCGKSAGPRMLAGPEDGDDGVIRIGDRDVTLTPPYRGPARRKGERLTPRLRADGTYFFSATTGERLPSE